MPTLLRKNFMGEMCSFHQITSYPCSQKLPTEYILQIAEYLYFARFYQEVISTETSAEKGLQHSHKP